MVKESAENIQKLKSCWDAGDSACVTAMRNQIETDGKAYAQLGVQDELVGRSYENSANWYADISDQCGGKCGWLESALAKTAADGLTNAVYGALGTGSVPKPGQGVKPVEPVSNPVIQFERQTTYGLKLKADPSKTTTVLGTFKDDAGAIINELKLPR
ncbi:hypothetical protein AACK17_18775 [Pectobacterium punjabense]|uniref:hypothetical protein n=1 Tax=Pectobacterium punjabense TaxID=2108399 RepID=UPI00311E2666